MDDEGMSAAGLAKLQDNVARASAETAREQERLEMATRGVTEAMAEQADAARARVDSAFGYQQALIDQQKALIDVTEAQTALDDARADGTAADVAAAELDLKEALLGVNTALSDRVKLAGDVAMDNLPAALDETQKKALGAKAELDELNKIIAEGTVLPPEMEQYRQSLIDITTGADSAALAQAQLITALSEVDVAASAIPGTKVIQISAPTDEVKQRLIDLGFTVTQMPDGSIRVEAKTEEAQANLGTLATDLANLDGTTAAPDAIIEDKVLVDRVNADFDLLNTLGIQSPTPVARLNDGPFTTIFSVVMGRLDTIARQNAMPAVTLRDYASAGIQSVQNYLNNLRDKTVTLTLNEVTNKITRQSTLAGGSGTGGAARGGAIEDIPIKRFAGGGAIVGRGSARDDLVPFYGPDPTVRYAAANGEHMLDGLDVLLMGGQAGVYSFRERLRSGRFGSPGPDTAVRAMANSGPMAQAAPAGGGGSRSVVIQTYDNTRAIMRAIRADEHEQAVLAPAW
jgi:hypothetical protein